MDNYSNELIDIKNGIWITEIIENSEYEKSIEISYQVNDENGNKIKLIEIILNKWNAKSRVKEVFFFDKCLIKIPDKNLIDVLINRLNELHKEFNIANYWNLSVIKEAKKVLRLFDLSENYESGNLTIAGLTELYNYKVGLTHFKTLDINGLLEVTFDNVINNEQRDLSLFSRDYLFAILSRKVCSFKTNDKDLIIKLANREYSSLELKKYEKEHGPLDPEYNRNNKSVDYEKEYSPLMYADLTLLNDRTFIIKFIDNTPHNAKNMEYISDEIKTNKTFISHCIKKGYTLDELIANNKNDKFVLDKEHTITILDRLTKVIKKEKDSKTQIARKVDWEKKNETSLITGKLGEELIFKYEKQKLKNAGREDLANLVKWVSKELGDGLGFDIMSYDPMTGEKIYIEVKSTKDNKFDSFDITPNEMAFASSKPNEYKLYWLNNVDKENPGLFICDGKYLLSNFKFIPSGYKAYFEDKKELKNPNLITK